MPAWIVIGSQWGDEGKGKVVDLLAGSFDLIARYQGGHNAGHTVRFGNKHFALHLIPSGILHPGITCVIGNGLVVDPEALLKEIDGLRDKGVEVADNLRISDRAHVIFPFHRELDQSREEAAGEGRIGTTSRGIGPAYEAKAARQGARVGDLLHEERLRSRVRAGIAEHRRKWPGTDHPDWDENAIVSEYLGFGRRLEPHVADTTELVLDALDSNQRVLCEGAQGTLLDVDHGSYPFVTSSNCVSGGACVGLGLPPTSVAACLGIAKAYTTRVGGGPFPTELDDEIGQFLRERGNEFGTSTGRPRRCGWFDAVVVRRSVRVSGLSGVSLMKLDVLDDLEEIRVCVAYELDGRRLESPPADADDLARVQPVYETLPGWNSKTVGVGSFEELPATARAYVHRLEELIGAPIPVISTGPRREETILRTDVPLLPGVPPPIPG